MSGSGLGRRAFLTGVGAGAGLLAVRGLGLASTTGPAAPRTIDEVLPELAASLTARQRELVLLPWDHPSRQVTNTLTFLDRPHLGTLLSARQQRLAWELCDAMYSSHGRTDMAGTFAVEGRFEGCTLAIWGEPGSGQAQAAILGGHVHARGSERRAGAEPLGGAVAYGHQIGNGTWRVEGNSFAYHSDALNRLYSAMDSSERVRATLLAPPHQLMLQPLAGGAAFPGVRVGSLSPAAFEAAKVLLASVLGIFPEAERDAAEAAIAANGGAQALHVSVFERKGFFEDMTSYEAAGTVERARRGDPYWQVWRIEGPGTVMHFQGHPHVHAYVNVVRDPARANLGESLGDTNGLSGEAMRRLLEAAMRRATGETLAWHHEEVPGRFCPGTVTTGLAWSLDPYKNPVVVATIEGRAMAAPLRARLVTAGAEIRDSELYRVASNAYFVSLADSFGEPERVDGTRLLVRDALVAHLRAGGLAPS